MRLEANEKTVSTSDSTIDTVEKISDNSNGNIDIERLRTSFLSHFATRFPSPLLTQIGNNFELFYAELSALFNDEKTQGLLKLVDKTHFLSSTFEPDDLVPLSNNEYYSVSRNDMLLTAETELALKKMAIASKEDGVTLVVSSAYRTYTYQKGLFERYAAQYGEAAASRFSARAGTSQHQLGTAIDFGSITDEFAETRAGKWVLQHAHLYGFSLSYPKDYEHITGYMWECWHYRYIGVHACALQKKWFLDIQQYLLEAIHFFLTDLEKLI